MVIVPLEASWLHSCVMLACAMTILRAKNGELGLEFEIQGSCFEIIFFGDASDGSI